MQIGRRELLLGMSALALVGCGGENPPRQSVTPPPPPPPAPPPPPPGPPQGSPFRPAVRDDYLFNLITDIRIEGGDPLHDYVINYEMYDFSGTYRVRLFLYDATAGKNVAFWGITTRQDLRARATPTVFLAHDVGLAEYSGVTATAWVDWSKLEWPKSLTTYSDVDVGGILPDRVTTRSEIMQDFTARSDPKIRLTVGSGPVGNGHFASFADAIASLYLADTEIHRTLFPCSDICTYSNQVVIECTDPSYSEKIEPFVALGIENGMLLPPFVTLRGNGATRLYIDDPSSTAPVLEAPLSMRLEGIVIENHGRGYAVHIDEANNLTRPSEIDGKLNAALVSIMQDCTFLGSARQLSWLIGCGISNGQTIRLDGCEMRGVSNKPMFGAHNSPNEKLAGKIEIVNTTTNDAAIGAYAVDLVKSYGSDIQHTVRIEKSTIANVQVLNRASGAEGFVRI